MKPTPRMKRLYHYVVQRRWGEPADVIVFDGKGGARRRAPEYAAEGWHGERALIPQGTSTSWSPTAAIAHIRQSGSPVVSKSAESC